MVVVVGVVVIVRLSRCRTLSLVSCFDVVVVEVVVGGSSSGGGDSIRGSGSSRDCILVVESRVG